MVVSLSDRLEVFEEVGVAFHVAVGAVAVGLHPLVAGDDRAVAEGGQQAAVALEVPQLGAEAAEAQRRHEGGLRARILGIKRQGAAKGGEADRAGRARAAVDLHPADQLGGKIARRVVGEGVVVAKRDAVEGDVVAAVIDTTDRGVLGLAQAGAVGLDVGDARGERGDRRVVGRGRDVVRDELERDGGLRLARIQAAFGRGLGEGRVAGRSHLEILEAHGRAVGPSVSGGRICVGGAQRERRQRQGRQRDCKNKTNGTELRCGHIPIAGSARLASKPATGGFVTAA